MVLCLKCHKFRKHHKQIKTTGLYTYISIWSLSGFKFEEKMNSCHYIYNKKNQLPFVLGFAIRVEKSEQIAIGSPSQANVGPTILR